MLLIKHIYRQKRSGKSKVTGVFKSKVVYGADGDIAGAFGLGERISRWKRLVELCAKCNLAVANTLFKLYHS